MASGDRPSTARKARTKSPKGRATDEDKEQSARFIETARQLDVDQGAEQFERAINAILPRKNDH